MANCNNKPRCGKCAGPHLTEDCVAITGDSPLDAYICVCGQSGHPAWSEECPRVAEYNQRMEKRRNVQQGKTTRQQQQGAPIQQQQRQQQYPTQRMRKDKGHGPAPVDVTEPLRGQWAAKNDDEDLKKVVVELFGVVKEMRGQLDRLERRVELLG